MVDDIEVVAIAADELVGAPLAVERVVAGGALDPVALGVAAEQVGGAVANHAERSVAAQLDVLEVRQGASQADALRRRAGVDDAQRVAAFASALADVGQFRRGVEDIGVVAEATGEGVDSGSAIQEVVPAVAAQAVGQDVAAGVEVRLAGQHELFEVVAKHEVHRREDPVGAAGCAAFADDVAEVVDHVAVVAGAAMHPVGAGSAIEEVVAGIADEAVGAAQSVELVVAGRSGELVAGAVAGQRPAGESRGLQCVAAGAATRITGEQVVGATAADGMDDLRVPGASGGVVVAGDC